MVARILLACRVGPWQVAGAALLLLGLAFGRAPLREIPDALFVSDGFAYYVYLPSLVIDNDLDLSNELARIPKEGSKAYFAPVTDSRRPSNPFPIGPALLWLPFFLLAHVANTFLGLAGVQVSRDGFGFPYELPVYCGAFAYGLASCWLIQRLLTEIFPHGIAARALFAVVFCTPLAYYLWIEPNMAHAVAAFAISLFVFLLWRAVRAADTSLLTWAGIGVGLGMVALIRPYNAVIAVAALPAAWHVARMRGRSVETAASRLAVCAIAAAVVFVPQLLASQALYGSFVPTAPGTGYDRMRWSRPDLYGVLVSIVSFFPFIALAFVGLAARPPVPDRQNAPGNPGRTLLMTQVRPLLLLAVLVTIYVTASFPGWLVGEALGQRRLVDWSLPLALGFATILSAVPQRWQRVSDVVLLSGGIAGVAVTGLYILKRLPEWGLVGAGW